MKYTDRVKTQLNLLKSKYAGMLPSEIGLDGKVYNGEREKRFKRVYRNIDAPGGSTYYWDQPLFSVAYMLGGEYAAFADNAFQEFLSKCLAENGMFLWGNHYYYHEEKHCVVKFIGEEDPVRCERSENGNMHELRPLMPNLDIFWKNDRKVTERYLRNLLHMHMVSTETGEFNRHADEKTGYAFLESGGILAEIACWLYKKTGDEALLDLAQKITTFSYGFRNEKTGLIENCPTMKRWDKYYATTETAHWAVSLLHCFSLTGQENFYHIAESAVSSYIKYGYDKESRKIYGCIRVTDGKPYEEKERETIYIPDKYSSPWQSYFPTHDYLFSLAEACILLWKYNKKPVFLFIAKEIAAQVRNEYRQKTFADNYGRAIQLMCDLYQAVEEESYLVFAKEIADFALKVLSGGVILKGHPDKVSCAAVDGVGILMEGLLILDNLLDGSRKGSEEI